MTDNNTAPERIWRIEAYSDFASNNHGIASWAEKELAGPNPTEYIRADALDARDAVIAVLRDALGDAVVSLEQATLTQIAAKHYSLANDSDASVDKAHAALARADALEKE